jgi:hypothetical protein
VTVRRQRRTIAFAAAGAASLVVLVASAAQASSSTLGPCDFGRPVAERALVDPHARTFYSRDTLNPDLVRVPGGYRLYFSGNKEASQAGYWQTGLAVGDSPLGPFGIQPRVRFQFLNGGTVWDGRHYYHAANATVSVGGSGPGALYRSRDGRHWRKLVDVPGPPRPAWDALRSDFYLVRRANGLDIYFAGRPGPSGADLGLLRYRHGRFLPGSELILARRWPQWDGLDLGEPAFFRARGRSYLLYAALAENRGPRRIGLAYRTNAGWRRCQRPFVNLSPRYPRNAIDPEPLVENGRLYLYFGGGVAPSLGGNMRGTIWVRVYHMR